MKHRYASFFSAGTHLTQTMEISGSMRRTSVLAGIGYIVIFLTGILANFFILEELLVPDDAQATMSNIIHNITRFRFGILLFIIMVVCDVLLTWALYILLRPLQKNLSLFAAWFRLANCVMFGVAVAHLLAVPELVSGRAYLAVFSPEQLAAQVMGSLQLFNVTWLIGLVFFGVHLLALGYIIIRSGVIPKTVGVLLVIAAVGYLVDSCAHFMMPDYSAYQDIFTAVVVLPGVVGELSLTLWLLFKGGRVQYSAAA